MIHVIAVVLLWISVLFSREIDIKDLVEQQQKQSVKEELRIEEGKLERPQKPDKEERETKEEEKLSRIERLYNSIYKGEEKLFQFGYDIFEREVTSLNTSVGDRYVLGPGDELVIYFWGDPVDILGLKSYYLFEVDREGKIFIPSVGVVYVWNKKLGDIREELKKLLSRKFKRFEIDVSVGKLRAFPVYVSGYVENPGIVLAKATYTVLDVLTLAGGISKNGSLRNIKLKRANGEKVSIDLYDFLIRGKAIDIFVREGDVIYVDEIGRTVGLAGAVKRPAIYELKDEKTFKDAIYLAGGPLFSAYDYGVRVYRYENNKLVVKTGKLNDRSFAEDKVKDGDLIKIEDVKPFVWNRVTVKGHVQYPGEYSIEKFRTLRSLLDVIGILPDTNVYYAEIVRRDRPGEDPLVINFAPVDVIEGRKDFKLKPLDEIIFYPNWVYQPIKVSGEVENPKIVPYYDGITLLDVLRDITYTHEIKALKAVIKFPDREAREKVVDREKTVYEHEEDKGKVSYGMNVKGTKAETEVTDESEDSSELEDKRTLVVYLYDLLTKGESNITLEPGTQILILKKKPNEKTISVTILGEVKNPGVYELREGMRLSDLIAEAGGYTEKAYPQGLIFIRESAKKLQEEHLRVAINALEQSLSRSEEGLGLTGASGEEKIALQITLRKQRELLNLIKERAKMGLGRIALNIPPTLEELRKRPDQDIVLEDGDYIFVPSRPNYVLVLGDVYNQISVPYVKGKPLSYYLEQVGGPGKNADLENIYVIKANGRVIARRNYERFFRFSWEEGKLYFAGDFMDMPLDEGDTIVVPTELKVPTMWRPLIRDVVQIIFQAISTAVLAKRL